VLKGWIGNSMSILGALLGGWLAFSTSRRSALLISGVGQVASFTLYVAAALGVGGIGLLWVATIAEGILGTMATVALFALMMDASDPEHAGTDYTLLACVVLIVGMIANVCGGAIADAFGYAAAFTTGAILALLGCLTLVRVLDRHQFSTRVALAWRTPNKASAATPSQTSATEY
jgi:MFS family permease